ncbi:MAG: hypothetical protein MJZ41_06460 [Bacteroidaceae bacterium]|nr:hypothetical protein [Bacteroidaceae bacterium]
MQCRIAIASARSRMSHAVLAMPRALIIIRKYPALAKSRLMRQQRDVALHAKSSPKCSRITLPTLHLS